MGARAVGDRATVIAAQRGDERALESVITRLGQELYPLALALTHGSGDADRLVGDALSRVYERLQQLETPDALFAWARRILVRRFLDERRWWSRRPQCSLGSVELHAPERDTAELVDLRNAVRGLDRRDRALLVLHYWQGLSISDCARELDIPEGTAKSRLSTALARLRRRLGVAA
jgi:RNA polymerase sigma-70 factor (ECF subfamily)